MVGGVAGEDVGEAGLHPHPDQREQAPFLPSLGRRELRRRRASPPAPRTARSGCGSDSVIAMSM